MLDKHSENYFNPIHSVAGFYKGTTTSRFYHIYSIVTDVFISLILSAAIYQLFTSHFDRKKESLTVGFVVCIAYSLALYYSFCFRLQYGKIVKLHQFFHETRSSLFQITDEKRVLQEFQNDIRHNKMHGYFACFASFMSAFLFSIQPLLRNAALFDLDGRKELQIDIWCPFEFRRPLVFEIMVFVQFLTVFTVALRFFANDSFFMLSMKISIGYFKLLTQFGETVFPGLDRMTNTSQRKSIRPKLQLSLYRMYPRPEGIPNYLLGHTDHSKVNIMNNEICELAELKLRLFIRNHQLILRCGNQLCDIYGPVMVMYLLSFMGFASVAAFGVIHTNGFRGPQTLAVGFFSVSNLLLLYFMCEAGDELALQSGKLKEALAGGSLYLSSRRVHSSLVLVLMRINCRVQAGVVGVPSMPLSLSTFAWFIKTLVSFYLFLVQIQEAKN